MSPNHNMFSFLRWGLSCWDKGRRAQEGPASTEPSSALVSHSPLEPLQSEKTPLSAPSKPGADTGTQSGGKATPFLGNVKAPQAAEIDSFLPPQAIEQMQANAKLRQSRLRIAQAAAEAGIGPQSWDREWFQNEKDHGRDVSAMTDGWGYHKLQDLIEVLDWALASPQGQRAQALSRDPNNPGAHALEMIQQMRLELRQQCHQLLSEHAEGLDYSDQRLDDLSNALHEARCFI